MYLPSADRYQAMPYRRAGRSGLLLPALSLGLWHNFGSDRTPETQGRILRRAFDLGITHFDLANNYGPPPGAAESAMGRALGTDFARLRDELVISTKAGYLMWDGPYGEWGSRKNLLSSLDQSLTRLGLDYVDIFYSHRPDPGTPLEETMGALDSAVRQGKALYSRHLQLLAGADPPGRPDPRRAGHAAAHPPAALLDAGPHGRGRSAHGARRAGHRIDRLLAAGAGHPLRPLSARHPGRPARRGQQPFLTPEAVTPELVDRLRALDEVASARGQSLAQLALAWVLRGGRVTSAVVGASSVAQLENSVETVRHLDFADEELARIEEILKGRAPG